MVVDIDSFMGVIDRMEVDGYIYIGKNQIE